MLYFNAYPLSANRYEELDHYFRMLDHTGLYCYDMIVHCLRKSLSSLNKLILKARPLLQNLNFEGVCMGASDWEIPGAWVVELGDNGLWGGVETQQNMS